MNNFLIHNIHLPLGVGLGVIMELLEEVKKANRECVLLVKEYRVINPVFM